MKIYSIGQIGMLYLLLKRIVGHKCATQQKLNKVQLLTAKS